MLKEIFLKKLNTQSKTVQNAIITLGDTDDTGKGKKFKSRFIQPGIAGYPGQFGNVLITKSTFDKFINTMIGVPVIINHKDITIDNADDERVGVVSSVWYDEKDGWYWCDGVIWNETAINLIQDKKWSVSCSYDVKLADDKGGTENNIPYDIEFLDGVFTHLAIVDNPRYERANIVFNSKTEILKDISSQKVKMTIENKIYNGLCEIIEKYTQNPSELTKKDIPVLKGVLEFLTVNNGWITLKDKVDENGKPIRVFVPSYVPDSPAVTKFHQNMALSGKENVVIYEYKHTKADISKEQKKFIENSIDEIINNYKVEPPLKGLNVCTIGGGCLGVAVTSAKTRTLSLDSSVFKENGTCAFQKSVEGGWLARTDKDVLTSVLAHELGHTITATSQNESFWNKIKEIKSEYVKNIKEDDIKNKDYISKYARKNKDEFVAESFAQATLLKNPSKYAKMVLDEVNKHFKMSPKEYEQLRLFNAVIGALSLDTKNSIFNKKQEEEIEITWIEGDGIGYCLTEEDYNARKKEVEKHTKEEMEQD